MTSNPSVNDSYGCPERTAQVASLRRETFSTGAVQPGESMSVQAIDALVAFWSAPILAALRAQAARQRVRQRRER